MKVSVAYATTETQFWRSVDVSDQATVEEVINCSGLLERFPIDLSQQKVGVFGKLTRLNAKVNAGDRVEIYSPITRVLDDDDDDDDDD